VLDVEPSRKCCANLSRSVNAESSRDKPIVCPAFVIGIVSAEGCECLNQKRRFCPEFSGDFGEILKIILLKILSAIVSDQILLNLVSYLKNLIRCKILSYHSI
jgi:hypothetical protein